MKYCELFSDEKDDSHFLFSLVKDAGYIDMV